MKVINFTVHYNSMLAKLVLSKNLYGFTLGNRIFFRLPFDKVTYTMLNHEKIHVCQYNRLGLFGFLYAYFWKERKNIYREKSLEVEAYLHEKNFEYIQQKYVDFKLVSR